jgi:hypothetical protein
MKAYACVGTHGKIYVCCTSLDLSKRGRLEVYDNWNDARANAWSEDHVREVTITIHRKKAQPERMRGGG